MRFVLPWFVLLICSSCWAQPRLTLGHLRPGVPEALVLTHAPFGLHEIPYSAVDGCYGWNLGPYAFNFDQKHKLRRVVCWERGRLERGGKVVVTLPDSTGHFEVLFGKPERVIPAGKGEAVWDYPKLRLAALVVRGKQVTMLELRSADRQQRLHIP